MAVTRCDFYTVYRRLVSALNAGVASSFTPVLDDPRRSPGELFASVQAADDEVCTLRAETEGTSFRTLFMADSSAITHGSMLPDHLGPIGQVRIKHASGDSDYRAGKFDRGLTLADIERWRANTGSQYGANHNAANSSTAGFYIQLGDELFFTGYEAIAKIATYARLSRDVTDGAMGAGSKNLTSATAAFIAADAGGAVLGDGAGASGVPLVSRIDSYTNSTTVVLRDANASGGNISAKMVTIAKLQAPQSDEDAMLAFAVGRQIKRGDNPPFAELWVRAADVYRTRIKSGEETLPKLELAQAV